MLNHLQRQCQETQRITMEVAQATGITMSYGQSDPQCALLTRSGMLESARSRPQTHSRN